MQSRDNWINDAALGVAVLAGFAGVAVSVIGYALWTLVFSHVHLVWR